MNRHLCGSFDCSNKKDCYEEFVCEFLKKPPYVCNAYNNKATSYSNFFKKISFLHYYITFSVFSL
jgi:hypothetical protein